MCAATQAFDLGVVKAEVERAFGKNSKIAKEQLKLYGDVAKLLGELLAERMREETGYEAAMRRFLSRRPTRLQNEGASYPDRDELHERDLLR